MLGVGASLVVQTVKNLPAMQEIWVPSPVGKDPLENPWKREQQPTPVFLPGEFHGQKSLVSYSPWGRKEPDTTELLTYTYIGIKTNTLIVYVKPFSST